MPRQPAYHGAFLYKTGEAKWYGNRFWHHPWFVLNCLCPDGKRRTIRLGQDADTAFTWPGRTSYQGKTRRGYIAQPPLDHPDHDSGEVMFYPYIPESAE